MKALYAVVTDQRGRRGDASAFLRRENVLYLGAGAPAEGADLACVSGREGRTGLQQADTQRTQQARADAFAFVHQTKQQMRRANALLSLAPHLLACQHDNLLSTRREPPERGQVSRRHLRLFRLALLRRAIKNKRDASMDLFSFNIQRLEKRGQAIFT